MLIRAALLAFTLSASAQSPVELAESHWQAHGAALVREWCELLAIPNQASDTANIRRNADWIVQAFARRGVTLTTWELEGTPPVVYGRWEQPGATRTLGIYLHYDGQPVEPTQWHSEPFTPTLLSAAREHGGKVIPLPQSGAALDDEWRLYARGSSDDRAPVAALLGVVDALAAAGQRPSSNLVFLFEGEEEAGSDHLGDYLRAHRDELAADLWVIVDGPVHQSRRPQLVFGARGIVGLEITVYGATRTLHSGHYGNWAPNPAQTLAALLTSMKDAGDRVLIPGYYDSVAPLSAREQEALAAIPPIDTELRAELGLATSEFDNYMQSLLRPSLNIRGFVSATVGATARNIVPNEATASIDLRLVKGNDPQAMLDLVERHIQAQGYHIVRAVPTMEERRAHAKLARITRSWGYRAVRTSMDSPLTRWLATRIEGTLAESLILTPTLGGSLPLYLFEDILQAPLVILPIANHDNNQHAPNENIRLGNLRYGLRAFASVLGGE